MNNARANVVTQRTLITDLDQNQFVDGIFAIQNCQLGMTKSGKPFIKCLVGDRSGHTPGRMWNASEELFHTLPTDGFVYLQGQTQPYQGQLQIIIDQIQVAQPNEDELRDLLPTTKYDIDEMFGDVEQTVHSIQHESIRALSQQYLNDEQMMRWFRHAPAAMSVHHAFLGGLLEHTHNLLRLAVAFCPLYPQLNRDIIIMGLFIHDLGKCVELTWERGFGYSDDGLLVGHVARGVLWLQQKADRCAATGTPVPDPILNVLHHTILSHHGKPEFGALKVPATPEAIAISLLDNLDARMQMSIGPTREHGHSTDLQGNFTEKIWALDTRLYRPDPTTVR